MMLHSFIPDKIEKAVGTDNNRRKINWICNRADFSNLAITIEWNKTNDEKDEMDSHDIIYLYSQDRK